MASGRRVILLLFLVTIIDIRALSAQQRAETRGNQSPAVIPGRDAIVNYGLPPEEVKELTKAAAAGAVGPLAEKVIDLSNKLGVTQGAAVSMLRIIGQQDVPLEKLPQALADVAEQYKSVMKRLTGLDPQDPVTRDLVARAKTAITAGHLDEADQLMTQAEQAELAAADQAQQLAEQAQAAAEQRLLRAADDRGVRGNIAMTKRHYRDAAQHFQKAADRVPAGHPNEKAGYLHNEADALYRQGDEQGDNAALKRSIETWHLVLQQRPRDRVPLDWAMTQNSRGNALTVLGERESGTAHLEEAVATFRVALEERTRDRVPLDWAATQNNLGIALGRLGERESGTARLEEAVTAYRAALEEWTRDRVPLDWAMTQNNRGNALTVLGERESGTAHLEEAVSAYRAALEERTRDRVPLDWAATQNNLGIALGRLGERESGTARLEEAVTAYRAALEEWTRDRVPLDWAMTQANLGVALGKLGERESETRHLEEAAAAFRAALGERTRDRVALDWAMTQANLGAALWRLGERESRVGRLKEAAAAYAELVEICRRVYASAESNDSKSRLVDALGSLSFVLLLNRRAGDALVAAQEALSLDPAALWVETNRAHALLFLSRSEEAKAVYVEYRGRLLFEQKTFAQVVREDLSEFRKYGIDTPEMKDIDALLSPTQEKH